MDLSIIYNNDKEQKQMEEAQQQLQERIELQLVRGAMLYCTCGSHPRKLNLPVDHGIITCETPHVHERDAVTEKTNPVSPNICWFGHCLSTSESAKRNLRKKIRLAPYVPKDNEGNFLSTPPESSSKEKKCVPEFVREIWKNCNENVSISEIGPFKAGEMKSYYNVVTMRSYIMCIHGGMIHAISSGQDEFNAYMPSFLNSPFPRCLTEGSPFLQWCEANSINPYWPQEDGYDAWFINKLEEKSQIASSFSSADSSSFWHSISIHLVESEAGKLYFQWLNGHILAGNTENHKILQQLENSPVRTVFYGEGVTLPPISLDISTVKNIFNDMNTMDYK
jgi:hypothetical protein